MSVEQRRIVDAIGTCKTDGHIVLTIADHLPFDAQKAHLLTLQDKINDYLDFIESGELCDAYPRANGRPIEILIYFKHPPDKDGLAFLASSERTIREAGYNLSFKVSPGQPTDGT